MILEAENIKKSYYLRKSFFNKIESKALESVSLNIPKGKTVGLIGESGCGKTTLGKIISKLLEPSEGRIIFDGTDITKLSKKEFRPSRHEIQMIFQDPNAALNPSHKIRFTLNECLLAKGIRENHDEIIENNIKKVGLDLSFLDRYPHELSGGQKQRIAILQASMMQPKLIIADEVVSALDVSVRSQILNLLKLIQKDTDVSYLFISHDLNVVYYVADYISVMYMGEIVEEGSADDIYYRHRHPYTKILFESLLDFRQKNISGFETQSRLINYEGCKFESRCKYSQEICKNQKPKNFYFENNHRVYCHRANIEELFK